MRTRQSRSPKGRRVHNGATAAVKITVTPAVYENAVRRLNKSARNCVLWLNGHGGRHPGAHLPFGRRREPV